MKRIIKLLLWTFVFTSFLLSFFADVRAGDFSYDKQNDYPWWAEPLQITDLKDYAIPIEWETPKVNDKINMNGMEKTCPRWCCWIKLNTNFPIIGNCISTGGGTDARNAFPTMIWALTKIAMALVFIVCFILIIVAWIMRAWAWWDSSQKTKAKNLIKKVAITILLLWFSGVILRLINPNFFA